MQVVDHQPSQHPDSNGGPTDYKSETIKSSLETEALGCHRSPTAGALPLAKFALKSPCSALEAPDDRPLDLLAGLPGSFAGSPVFPSLLIEVGDKTSNRSENRGAGRLARRDAIPAPRPDQASRPRSGRGVEVERVPVWSPRD